MRVISGTSKGMRLMSVEGMDVRPTSDRVKESVFNMVGQYFHGKEALDLFCGSGGNGIEFLSRGAKSCVFVDTSSESLKVTRENLKHTKLTEGAKIINMDYKKYLKTTEERFDIIYMDPPFNELQKYRHSLEIIKERKLLKKDGLLVVEYRDGSRIDFANYEVLKERKYGSTSIKVLGVPDESNICG